MILISFIADDHAEASVNFNKDTFAEDVEKTPHLVMFYAPWYVICIWYLRISYVFFPRIPATVPLGDCLEKKKQQL